MPKSLACLALVLTALLASSTTVLAAVEDDVRTTWRLIDYMAVDYAGAVRDGAVVSEHEYAEMQEFANTIRERITALPEQPDPSALLAQAEELVQQVDGKAPAEQVRETARGLASALLAIHPVPTAPETAPDLARGAALYEQQCASCHGASGRGDGPAAQRMEPPPIDFTNVERARERSVFALYEVIRQGLEGTPMVSYGSLPEADQWALAFYVSTLAFPQTAVEAGRRRWQSDPALRAQLPGLDALVQVSPAALAQQRLGAQVADEVVAYLRRSPEVVQVADTGRLAVARNRLDASVAAYRAGDRGEARQLALSAYLDGFEPLEPIVATRGDLVGRVEGAMNAYRAAIAGGAPLEDVAARAAAVRRLFDEVESELDAPGRDFVSVLLAAATILLREGIEAMLVVVAMIAFLRKAGRDDVIPYIHAGWVGALAAGALTWVLATRLVSISGASRELTEGIGSALAAVVLVMVGLWMHHKSIAGRWQQYVRDKLSAALTNRSLWALAVLAFVVVYREVFETILFYVALWSEGNGRPLLVGLLVGSGLLAVSAWSILRASRKLPIGTFFSWSSVLIAVLAFVLAGKGVAALQEAGVVGVTPVDGPRLAWLGIFPTLEGLAAQALVLLVIAAGFAYNRIGAQGASNVA